MNASTEIADVLVELTCDDAEQRDEASRHLPRLLEDPLTIDKVEHLVAVLR